MAPKPRTAKDLHRTVPKLTPVKKAAVVNPFIALARSTEKLMGDIAQNLPDLISPPSLKALAVRDALLLGGEIASLHVAVLTGQSKFTEWLNREDRMHPDRQLQASFEAEDKAYPGVLGRLIKDVERHGKDHLALRLPPRRQVSAFLRLYADYQEALVVFVRQVESDLAKGYRSWRDAPKVPVL